MSDSSLLMFSLKILQSGYWKFYVHYFGKILIYALDIIYPYLFSLKILRFGYLKFKISVDLNGKSFPYP